MLRGLNAFLPPRRLHWVGLAAIVLYMAVALHFDFPPAIKLVAVVVIPLAQAALIGAIAYLIRKPVARVRPRARLGLLLVVLACLSFDAFLVWCLASPGDDSYLVSCRAPRTPRTMRTSFDPNDPSLPGKYLVRTLTYGSGENKRSPEFGSGARLITNTIDLTPFVAPVKGWKAAAGKRHRGFDLSSIPVNGTVWHPADRGPFPLVLIVHGNRHVEEPSDTGYRYLGRLLASRGFIVVSVDANDLNRSISCGGFSGENNARAMMLLKHLEVWKKWHNSPVNPFFGKVDFERIALVGHSRGGEAVALAALFNTLPLHPDDASVKFDLGLRIRSVVALAPTDAQYLPAGRLCVLENVNYLVIQGAHDADASVFPGSRQYDRVEFTDGGDWFKASVYSYRSNHSQFIESRGRWDEGLPRGLLLNRAPLLRPRQQRRVAAVYVTSFLEATLHGREEYVPFFRDHRAGAHWLPRDIYITRFEDSTCEIIADFEEDSDLSTATLDGAVINGHGLAACRERDLRFRTGVSKLNHGVFLSWEPRKGRRWCRKSGAPSYSIALPEDLGAKLGLSEKSCLTFAVALSEEMRDRDKMVDMSVQLVTRDGATVSLPLSDFQQVPPALEVRLTKFGYRASRYGSPYEPTLQTVVLPLSRFVDANGAFSPARLSEIRFVFDRSRDGAIIIDDVGFMDS
jgi:dienelactone hydrolase